MINRALKIIIDGPFDFFNDYTNTYNYLINSGYISLALHLERRNDDYRRRCRETELDTKQLKRHTKSLQ